MQLEALRRLLLQKLNSAEEARHLIEIAYGFSATEIMTKAMQEVDENLILPFLERRLNQEPLQRIKGSTEFYGLEFLLNEATLIPRADTEILVEQALKLMPTNAHILDLGTGTGCIIISLLHQQPTTTGVACDISPKALEMALLNAKNHDVDNRLTLIHSNWFSKIEGKFDVIVSNPPYIAFDEARDLTKEVLEYDPKLALFAESNGLAAYEALFKEAKRFLKPNGKILVEIGYKQTESVRAIAEKHNFSFGSLTLDYAKNPRVLMFTP